MAIRLAWRGLLAVAFLLLGLSEARAAIYNCTVNGVKTFSESPCGADAKEVKTRTEATITFGTGMKPPEIEAFCSLMMRGQDASVANNANATQRSYYDNGYYGYYGGGVYTSPSQDSSKAVQGYILSHISNLHQLAHDSPSMYRYVTNMAATHSYAQGQRAGVRDDTDREAEQAECVNQVSSYLRSESRR